jgi:paraquat-inducible protein A
MQSVHYCGCNLSFNGFGVVLPLLTTGVLLKLHGAKASKTATLDKYLHWMHMYSKWSMLDVFMVAVLVASINLER